MNIRVLGGKGARKMLLLKAIWTVASIGILAICAVGQSDATEAEISQALSASPASIAAHASVVVLGDKREQKGVACWNQRLDLYDSGLESSRGRYRPSSRLF
jgi:uncharacterized lipoprotein YajG